MDEPNRTTPSIHIQPSHQRGNGRIFKRKGSPFFWCAYYLRGKECTRCRATRFSLSSTIRYRE
jgi:hypothetical protein